MMSNDNTKEHDLRFMGTTSQLPCSQSLQHPSRMPLYDLVNGVFVANYKLSLIPETADGATSALRMGIWQNHTRNNAVIDVARAIVERNADRLLSYHIGFGGGKLPEELDGVRWLAILVGNKEHALAVQRLVSEAALQYVAAGELMNLNASMAMPLLTVTTVMAAHLVPHLGNGVS